MDATYSANALGVMKYEIEPNNTYSYANTIYDDDDM